MSKFKPVPKGFGKYENPAICKCGREVTVSIQANGISFLWCRICDINFPFTKQSFDSMQINEIINVTIENEI